VVKIVGCAPSDASLADAIFFSAAYLKGSSWLASLNIAYTMGVLCDDTAIQIFSSSHIRGFAPWRQWQKEHNLMLKVDL
jgi:hypothetical protein